MTKKENKVLKPDTEDVLEEEVLDEDKKEEAEGESTDDESEEEATEEESTEEETEESDDTEEEESEKDDESDEDESESEDDEDETEEDKDEDEDESEESEETENESEESEDEQGADEESEDEVDSEDESKSEVIEKLYTTATIKGSGDDMIAVASEETEDRDGEVMSIDGWELKNFKSNPVMLWMHNRVFGHDNLPIGHVESIGFKRIGGKKKLIFKPKFDESNDFNRTVAAFYKDGVMNSFSVGFLAKEREKNKYMKQELLEISAVPVPSLAEAQVIQRAKELGIDKYKALEIMEIKGPIPYKKHKLSPEAKKWHPKSARKRFIKWAGGPSEDKISYMKFKDAFSWYRASDTDSLDSYKFSHHDIAGGKPVTVWKGVVAAMAMLLGARGGIKVPERDKKRIYDHLAKHYKEFNKEVPGFGLVESQEIKHLFEAEKEALKARHQGEIKKHIQYIAGEMKRMANEKKQVKVDKIQKTKQLKQDRLNEALALVNVAVSKAFKKANETKK